MAAATPNPNQGPAQGPTPADIPRGAANPLAGTEYAQLGEEINRLKEKMNAGTMSARELAQEQANLIDNHQALVGMRIREMAAADNLSRKIKELAASTEPAARESSEYKNRLTELEKSLKTAQERATDLHKAAKQVGEALNKVVKSSESRTKAETEADEKKANLSKMLSGRAQEAGAAIGKASGAIGDIARISIFAASKVPALGAAIGGVLKFLGGAWTGGVLTAASIMSSMFKTATRESTAFANAFGTQLGFAIDQQNAFKTAIPGWAKAYMSVADIQKTGSAAMKAGAYDAYTATRLMRDGNINMREASIVVAKRLAYASQQMMGLGQVLGMTAEQSGAMLGTFTTTMGAFDPAAASANARLGDTINRFGLLNKVSGMAIPNLMSLIGEISEETLGMGISFDTVTAQTGMLMRAVMDYGSEALKSGNMLFASGAGFEKVTRMLLGLGSSLSATQTYGYQLVAGLTKTKDPFKGIIEAAAASPVERMMAQVKAWKAMGLSTDQMVASIVTADKKMEKFGPTLQGMLGSASAMKMMENAAKAKDQAGVADAFKNLAPDMQKTMADMVASQNLARDPIEQLVTLTQNGNAYLSNLVSLFQRFIPGYVPKASPQAMDNLAKTLPLGRK